MVYYNGKKESFNGGLILYQRDLEISNPMAKTHNKPKWYMRVKIKGMKGRALVRCTKLTEFEDAHEYAKEEYSRLHSAIRLGHTIDEYTFEQHWNEWFERKLKKVFGLKADSVGSTITLKDILVSTSHVTIKVYF